MRFPTLLVGLNYNEIVLLVMRFITKLRNVSIKYCHGTKISNKYWLGGLKSYDIIKQIGGCIGEAQQLHYTKQSFDSVEATIILNEDLTMQKSIIVKEGSRMFNVVIQESKVVAT